MSYIIKTMRYNRGEGYMEHNAHYAKAKEWLEARYGPLSDKFEFNADGSMAYIGRYDKGTTALFPVALWEDVEGMFLSDVSGLELPYMLDYLGKCFNDQVILWDTERCMSIEEAGSNHIADRLVHDIVVILPDDIVAVEFKLAVG